MKRDAFTLPPTVAVLFARADSIYKTLPGTDVWDIERNARLWPGGAPVVAHPPCRAWGRLRQFAKPRKGERQLAIWSVRQVRRFGGVLEHPVGSLLWKKAGLPPPGQTDRYGGWTLPIHQNWWGHRAEKATLLYIVGCPPGETPPFRSGSARQPTWSRAESASTTGRTSQRPSENTPRQSLRDGFASWPADARSAGQQQARSSGLFLWSDSSMNTIPITQAVRLLRAAAQDLRECHTRGNEDWTGEAAAKAAHDEHMAVAEALEAQAAAKCLHQIAEHAEYPFLPQSVGDVVDFMDGRPVDIDWSHPAPSGGTRLYTAAQMRAYVDTDRAQRAAPASPAQQDAPVANTVPAPWADSEDDKPTDRRDLERVLFDWNQTSGALQVAGGWCGEVLGMIQDAYDLGAHQAQQDAPAAVAVPEGWTLVKQSRLDEIARNAVDPSVDCYLGRNYYDEQKVQSNWRDCQAKIGLVKDEIDAIQNGWDNDDLQDALAAAPAAPASQDAQDAARYRWLRDTSVPPHNFYLSVPDEFKDERYSPREVDAAIDAALAAQQAGGK